MDESNYKKGSPTRKGIPNAFSRSLFCWMLPLFWNGNRRDLEEYDLRPTVQHYSSSIVGEQLEKNWLKAERKLGRSGRKPIFWKILAKTFLFSYMRGGIMQFLNIVFRTMSPLLFSKLLQYWSTDSTMSRESAVHFAIGIILVNWMSSYLKHHGQLYCQQFGMKLRVATSSLIFRKIMRMSNASLAETTAGKVVNLLSNDLQRFDMAMMLLHYIWIIPIQLTAVVYLGYLQAGYAAVFGFVTLIAIALPIQAVLGQNMGRLRIRTAKKTDERINTMTEVINGIQVIKMYAWELPFQKLVGQKRKNELREVKISTTLRLFFLGFVLFTDKAALFIAVLAYVLFGNNLSANFIYPLQQFMNAVTLNITWIVPMVISYTSELIVSLGRIQEILSLDDRPDLIPTQEKQSSSKLFRKISVISNLKVDAAVRPLSYHTISKTTATGIDSKIVLMNPNLPEQASYADESALIVHDVSASWTGDPNYMALQNISFSLRRGKLCAIIGAVGAGKTSILQLLLKELPAASGSFTIKGTISYACQVPWLFSSTIRENILFGLPFEAGKYTKVCKVCSLERDFKQFPFGDQTLVGERGVSLSGGQRARINLARAIYRESDIYLLDDPLSAVDVNVGRQLFEDCINGYLHGKTRILVTHQIHFLKAADYIIVLNKGRIINMGTYDELVAASKELAMLLSTLQVEKDTDNLESKSFDKKEKSVIKNISLVDDGTNLPEFEAQKMKDEERQSGNLKWEIISSYFNSGGSTCFVIFALFFMVLTNVSSASVDYWISYWTNKMETYENTRDNGDIALDTQIGTFTTTQYLIIHGSLVLACVLVTNLRVFLFTHLCVTASNKLHNNMFANLLRGIMQFFDTSTSGRILNRFTKDMGVVDDILPRTLQNLFQIFGILTAVLVLNVIALYWTLIPSTVLLVLFYIMVQIYMKAAQGVKRLEGTTKSPVFGMVTSSLNGISTIRSANAQERLINEFDSHQDLHSSAWNSYLVGGVTFGFWLDIVSLMYLTCVIFIFLFIDFGDVISIGSVGLAVTQSISLTGMLQLGSRWLVELFGLLTSVERILDYTKIENEKNLFEGQIDMPPTWPTCGKIVFENVSLRYAPNEAPVLKNLNIVVESGWKVGIVGRTGAGKSSLISALFRLAHIDGLISIDGLDTSLISRQGLRSKISIIPQEPILFSATIRYNLDPFDMYSDDDLWRALEQVDLKSAVPSLDFKVSEGGANFSVGQRQLMCLARALLRSNQILVMDEATANVDSQTDNFIQTTIRRQFASCTVLTIAHRLNTIMDSDRVLVMNSGEVVEFDHPYLLLSDPNSLLSFMVRETGDKNSAPLFQMAKEAYYQSNTKEASS